MFKTTDTPRVFGVPPGADFPEAVAHGVVERLESMPPEALARVRILVNTRRMQRRLRSILASGPARLLPRIGLVTDVPDLVPDAVLPSVINPLSRRLSIAELVARLIDADPTLAPRAALFDLTDSLIRLLDEMHGENVDPKCLADLQTGDFSGHWERSRLFLNLVTNYLDETGELNADAEAMQRAALYALQNRWETSPPTTPVIIAGSTGSRGTTFALMELVAKLPQGAVILPGFDTDLPHDVWAKLSSDTRAEDHPQYRFARLLSALDLVSSDVKPWGGPAPDIARNNLISLSLRPAPVTDQWLTEGQSLCGLKATTQDISLIEAPNARLESTAIAVAMREAVSSGHRVALITPDRTLGRRVTAALSRWDIVPDDSAGRPVAQTAPGRLLRLLIRQIGQPVTSEDLIALLRHPLANTGGTDRGPHLRFTQEFELHLRKTAAPEVTSAVMERFPLDDPERAIWVHWVSDLVDVLSVAPESRISALVAALVERAEELCRGPTGTGSGELWEQETGRDARRIIDDLLSAGDTDLAVTPSDVTRLVDRALQGENTRNRDGSRSDVMIWGTLEARVQGADVVILGGLNEGVWPARPDPDPWLNRAMRRELGLLLPERQIGLAAHDYQQAVSAPKVVLSRSLKDDDTETVASRWMNRLTNLLNGLPEQGGQTALNGMRARGQRLIDIAASLDQPKAEAPKAVRPAPAPPPDIRPKVLSVTEIERLIRDPYAIYAKHVLGLRALNAIRPSADAALRGTVFHTILQRVIEDGPLDSAQAIENGLLTHARQVLEEQVQWPSVRMHWLSHLTALASGFAEDELGRSADTTGRRLEVWGEMLIDGGPFGIRGKADRIDHLREGTLAIYDYKSGGAPAIRQILYFQRQLPIEAVMAEAGAFDSVPPAPVSFVGHIGLNKALRNDRHEMVLDDVKDFRTGTIKAELVKLLGEYAKPGRGYPSRRAMEKMRWDGDYDHLARFGEWDATDPAEVIVLP